MKPTGSMLRRLFNSPQSGLVIVILFIGVVLSFFAGSHVDHLTGRSVNNFLNPHTLMQTATDASFFAIMAVGATLVIITCGIDLSVGSIYALSGIAMAMTLRAAGPLPPAAAVSLGLAVALGVGLLGGLLNGTMITGLKVHPFIITLGTMWIFRGLAFVASKAESILVPDALTGVAKASVGGLALYPVPMLVMLAVTALGAIYLGRTVMGRHVYAIGGSVEASRYAGLALNRILIGVYVLSGLTAGIAAFLGTSYYGSASCADATGYELYVIASAVVGGASLTGGKGSALSAMLGAILIILIRQSIRTLHLDQNYEWIIIGCAIIVAVVLDRLNARLAARRLLQDAAGDRKKNKTALFKLAVVLAAAAAVAIGALGIHQTVKKRIKIAVIGKSSTNPVFLSARSGAEAAARDLSAKHNLKITIDWRTPPTEDGQVQAQRLTQAVNEGADAVLISCSDAAKVTGAINDAVARGVAVMTFDSDAPQSKRFAFYGVDDAQAGEQVMRALASTINGRGRVAILAGNQNAPNLRKRAAGAVQEAARHPGIEIVGTFYHAETPQDAAAEVVRVMNAYPGINAWAMIGGWALFTKTLLNDLDPAKVKVVAIDALPAELPYISKGIAPILLAQPTYNWGYVSVEKIVDHLVLGHAVSEINRMELVSVTQTNLGAWARQLQAWGFADVPEEYLKLPD